MIERRRGDLLKADVEALVNTVNCVGVMGKGIALQFKLKFPGNFRRYKKVCDRGELEPGRLFVFDRGDLIEGDGHGPRYVVNFPTKTHWRSPSKLSYIEDGMDALVREVERRRIASIAIPPLGCGGGGLDWGDVEAIITSRFEALPGVRVVLFPPGYRPRADALAVNTERPAMTRGRALVVKLFALYQQPGYRHGLWEAQKLAYLLQRAGEALRLDYVAHDYGPYANNLNHVLQRIEGHFTKGYGDRDQGAEIRLLPGAVEEAEDAIAGDPEAQERLERVRRLIEGFETPFGLELLATVLWVAQEDARARRSVHEAIKRVHAWNRRKKRLFTPQHVETAWDRLRDEGWLEQGKPVAA